LKEHNLPVAGVDRMLLTEQLAVMDLMAVARFTLLPSDDLTLATVLKSPLIGFDDDALFALAYQREGSLWRALQERAHTDERCAAAHRWLSAALDRADFETPFAFFAHLLNRPAADGDPAGSGRRKLLARLGREAEDPLSEFLDLTLVHERTAPPSLQEFIHRLDRSDVEVKRDPEESSQNAIRVMTVHGAKGLQAPIVFLPDTCQEPDSRGCLVWTTDGAGRPLMLWPPRARFTEDLAADGRRRATNRQTDEFRRLLYVAMTRAKDRLIVCGWLNGNQAKGPPEGCWHRLIEAGVRRADADPEVERTEGDDPFLAAQPALIDDARVLRLACPQRRRPAVLTTIRAHDAAPLPAWARRPPPTEPPTPRPLRPSRPDDEPPPVLAPLAEGGRFLRGRLIHRLLQELPDVAAKARAAAARRWLDRPVHGLSPDARSEIAGEVMAVVEDPRFAPLFGPGSRAEVPISGDLGGRAVAGQIDRLLVTPDEVTILDYKSDRPAPATAAAVSPVYLRQMAIYRSLLRRIYPGREVRCVLLWTEAPRAMPLPDALLDRALDRWAP
jgi:ATP-dependent helicase/nuclease subunit A